jgi:hypothetical protein
VAKRSADRKPVRRPAKHQTAKRAMTKRATTTPATKRGTAGRAKKTAPQRSTTARRAAARKTTSRPTTAARAAASRSKVSRSQRARSDTPRATPNPSRFAAAATAFRGALAGGLAAVTDRLSGTAGALDAIALLEKDHRRFEELLKRGEASTERAVKARTDLLDTLTVELDAHELVEEKILYPALKRHPEAKDIVLEGYQEHHVADLIVKELHSLAKNDEKWGPKFKVLKESLEHHIQEEEGEMFRTARGIFSRDELFEMGARMARMKAEARRPLHRE